jgi:hypothetical protein
VEVITVENKTAIILSLSNHQLKTMQSAVPANKSYTIKVQLTLNKN